jgi:hypothetical protein
MIYMRFIIFLFAMIMLGSCKSSVISQQLSTSDSLIIQFFNEDGVIYKAVTSTEKAAIRKLIYFVDGSPSAAVKCGYDGRLIFFTHEKELQRIEFNKEKGCRHFSFLLNDNIMTTEMSNEAADFLLSLETGKNK